MASTLRRPQPHHDIPLPWRSSCHFALAPQGLKKVLQNPPPLLSTPVDRNPLESCRYVSTGCLPLHFTQSSLSSRFPFLPPLFLPSFLVPNVLRLSEHLFCNLLPSYAILLLFFARCKVQLRYLSVTLQSSKTVSRTWPSSGFIPLIVPFEASQLFFAKTATANRKVTNVNIIESDKLPL